MSHHGLAKRDCVGNQNNKSPIGLYRHRIFSGFGAFQKLAGQIPNLYTTELDDAVGSGEPRGYGEGAPYNFNTNVASPAISIANQKAYWSSNFAAKKDYISRTMNDDEDSAAVILQWFHSLDTCFQFWNSLWIISPKCASNSDFNNELNAKIVLCDRKYDEYHDHAYLHAKDKAVKKDAPMADFEYMRTIGALKNPAKLKEPEHLSKIGGTKSARVIGFPTAKPSAAIANAGPINNTRRNAFWDPRTRKQA